MARFDTLISASVIAQRVAELGAEITKHYGDEEVVVVGILKGSVIFLADLLRQIQCPTSVEFLGVSSYGDSTKSSGVVNITLDLKKPLEGRHLLVVEDIVDTGLTCQYLLSHLQSKRPKSLKLAAFLYKPSRAEVEVPIEFLGFEIEDKFVVGYGLDYAQHYRNLPDLCVLHLDD